ncbi:hypothetical protein EEX84_13385 [Planococcus salinus]|uniref:Uncharacterized protein n=1 Tax=Planococcus salinus TaxID=1848460 RepID=A0A3M8P5D1_9BACL|nr:hypothetical protein EEX84_13385 [Planococcus salinus]
MVASRLALRTSFNPGLSNRGAIETEKRISLNEVRAFFIYSALTENQLTVKACRVQLATRRKPRWLGFQFILHMLLKTSRVELRRERGGELR